MITGPRDTIKRARKLRSEMTLPEVLLWKEMQKRPGDFKFRRQHGAGKFVLDFYCASVKLAIEVDGAAHNGGEAERRDDARSHYLRSQGIGVTRIPAKAVLSDKDAVILRLVEICAERKAELALKQNVPLHHPADGPPPLTGEDS